MHFRAASVVTVLFVLCSQPAIAQMYRCTANGATVYQQAPCPGGRELKAQAAPTPEDAFRAKIELAIARNQVIIGMSAKEVVRSWGEPSKINRSVTARTVHEQWVYRRERIGDDQYIYLENGIVKSFQTPG